MSGGSIAEGGGQCQTVRERKPSEFQQVAQSRRLTSRVATVTSTGDDRLAPERVRAVEAWFVTEVREWAAVGAVPDIDRGSEGGATSRCIPAASGAPSEQTLEALGRVRSEVEEVARVRGAVGEGEGGESGGGSAGAEA